MKLVKSAAAVLRLVAHSTPSKFRLLTALALLPSAGFAQEAVSLDGANTAWILTATALMS